MPHCASHVIALSTVMEGRGGRRLVAQVDLAISLAPRISLALTSLSPAIYQYSLGGFQQEDMNTVKLKPVLWHANSTSLRG